MKETAGKGGRLFSPESLHIWALGVIVLTVSVPLMVNYCIDGVDVSFYLRQLTKASSENIFLLLPSLMVKAGMEAEFVYKLFLAVLNLVTAVVAFFCFQRIFQDKVTGLIGSMLYTWAPYRLNDLYCRADLGEAVALCFLPIIFYGLYMAYFEDADSMDSGRSWNICILLTAGYTLIAQAYLLSFLVAAGFTVLFALVMWRKTFKRSTLALLIKTAAAFLVCNAWLFLRIFAGLRNASFSMAAFRNESIQSGGVFPSVFLQVFFINGSSFRTEGTGTADIQPLGVGFAVTAGVLIYLWLVFVGKYRDKENDRGIRSFAKGIGIVGAFLAFLSTNIFPWDYLQKRNGVLFRLVESLQSPARLMQAVLICFTILTCTAIWQVRKWEKSSAGRIFAIVTALLALFSVQYLTGDILRTREPRSLYGVEYGEPEGEERLLPENLDISPWDYGRYVSF